MPTVAQWGWNGNARRYWDFVYGGKLGLLERMIHHYGSSLNALPLPTSYKYNRDPSSAAALYDLRVGYGGIMGPLSNINAEGFVSTAFHSYPNRLKWDGYSGDYGPSYLGVIMGSCTYLVQHPDFGWISMGGNVAPSSNNDVIVVEPRDTVRRSIYVAAMGLSVAFESGVITSFAYEPQSKKLTITLQAVPGDTKTASTIVKYESTLGGKVSLESPTAGVKRGGYVVWVLEKVVFTAR
ncbi:hypothetical protein E4U56_004892 [Claviceps arundinis]|nr:hypothetical protein E4U56_004892 [Claviceps arundinis]